MYQDSLERRKIPSSVRRKNGIEAHSIDRDRQHRIEYTIDQPSLAYIFSIYKTLEGIGDKSEIRRKLHLDRYDLFMIKMTPSGLDLIIRGYMQNVVDFKGSDESGAHRLESLSKEAFQSYVEEHQREILTSVFRAMLSPIKTLQIKRDATKMQADDRQLVASFLYVRGRGDAPIYRLTSNLTSVLKRTTINQHDEAKIEIEPPRKMFNVQLIEMYLNARQTLDDYGAFLGYYHILEFFFDEAFKITIGTKIQNMITRPDFSYTDINSIYAMAKKSSKLIHDSKHGDQGNERASLKYVLMRYVHEDDFHNLETEIEHRFPGKGLQQYHRDFSSDLAKVTIDFSSRDRFCETAMNRIYMVRNALVHAKSEAKRYEVKRDQKQLHVELYLVAQLAESVSNNSADILV